jgi:glucosamine-6-phosphate deaminase
MSTLATGSVGSYSIEQIKQACAMRIEVVENREELAVAFAEAVLQTVRQAAARRGGKAVVIMPVGPTGQWRLLAKLAVRDHLALDCLHIIQMDEYLEADGAHWVPESHPLSFRGFVRRSFADQAVRECGFRAENWLVPDPAHLERIDASIREWGGVDVAFGGVGLNGHLAFNEPPAPSSGWTTETFADSPARVQHLAETTKATNSIFGTGGDLTAVPDYAATIGMRHILVARKIHLFLDWPWQRSVFRRAVLGPVTTAFPASLVQHHGNVWFTITREVAAPHGVQPE